MIRTCFVIMPIGTQIHDGIEVTSSDLRNRYDDLIKEALLKARPYLEVTRADDVAAPGAITSDILTRIMHSDIVVADITYPNPNVFYELGLRHASRNGTIIIRDSAGHRAPFDISNLRHIEYTNTPTGLRELGQRFRDAIDHFDRIPNAIDSSFQELAKLTGFEFPSYSRPADESEPMIEVMLAMMQSPELMDLMVRSGKGEEIDQREMFSLMSKNPVAASQMMQALVRAGHIDLSPAPSLSAPKSANKKRRPRTGG